MRFNAILYLVVALATASGLAWGVAVFSVGSIEKDTVTRIKTAFNAAGIDWATPEPDGLMVVVTGKTDGESTRVRMLETASQVIDTSRIVDQTLVERSLAAAEPEFSLEILRHNRDLSLIGLIPGMQARINVLRSLADIRDPNSFSDFLEAVDYAAPDGWDTALNFGLQLVNQLERSTIVVRPGGIEVNAFLNSQAEMAATRARISASAPDSILLRLDLRAPKSVVSPFTFSAEITGNSLKVGACSADSDVAQGQIFTALSDFGVVTDCDLALGSASEDWADAVVAVLASLKRMQGGQVVIEDTDITLTAPLGMDEVAYGVESTKLNGALPGAFSLTTVLPSKPKPRVTEETRPPELNAVLLEDGQITLDAPLRNQLALDAARNFAAARFGNGQINTDLRVDQNVPEGWSGKVLASLDALSLLNAGEVHLNERSLNIFGVTAQPDGSEDVNRILEDLGQELTITADVAYDPKLAPVDEIVTLSDTACERALANIMREFQITFAPSSAAIDGSSAPVIDEISAVLKTCPNTMIEVGGHTDSQGRESMNMGLSQARADAVLDALLVRDVLVGNLSAKGYGESLPIADNETEEGRAANRRIAFKLLVAETSAPSETEEDPNEQN